MATESPAIHDGSQTVAAADYSSSASLYGMTTAGLGGTGAVGGSGQYLFVALSASVARTSVLASVAGQKVYGVLQNKPKAGEAADVVIFGITKVVTGTGGVTLGVEVTTDANGAAVVWTTGSAKRAVGVALETVAAAGVATIMFTGNALPIT